MKAKRLLILSSAAVLWLYPSHNAYAATFGEKMARAGLNTLLGMGTVFAVLIFISFIISLFKYIPMLQNKLKNDGKVISKKESSDYIDEKSIVSQEPILEEDLYSEELVAVIAAAVAAAEGGFAEDFVVYSIKKRNHWCRS